MNSFYIWWAFNGCSITYGIFIALPPVVIVIAGMTDTVKSHSPGPKMFWYGLAVYYILGMILIPQLNYCM